MKPRNVLCEACNLADIGIVLLDSEFRIVDANMEIERRSSVKVSAIIGKNILDFVPDEKRDELKDALDAVKNGKDEVKVITELITPPTENITVKLKIRRFGEYLMVSIIDMRQQVEMHRALLKSEELFRAIAESSLDGVILIDSKGTILFWNSAAERIYGYSRDEVLGKNVMNIIVPPELRENYKKGLANFSRTGEGKVVGRVMEFQAMRKDGSIIPVEISIGTAKVDEQWHAIAVVRDISERKMREKKMQEEKRELELLYAFLNRLSHTIDPVEIFVIAYREVSKIMKDMDSFFVAVVDEEKERINVEFIVGEGKRYPPRSIEMDERATLTAWVVAHGEELYIRDMENDPMPAGTKLIGTPMRSWVGIPLKANGKTIGVLSVQSKKPGAFTENELRILRMLADGFSAVLKHAEMYRKLKLSEEKYRALVENSIVGVVTTNLENRITFVNEFFAKMLGYTTKEMLGKKPQDFATRDGAKKLIDGTKRRKLGLSDSYEAEFIRKDGSVIPVLIYASPLRDMDGEITGTLGIIMDISELKKMEDTLERERKKYRGLFENVATGIVILQDEVLVYVNEELQHMLGYKGHEMLGSHFSKFVHPDEIERLTELYRRRIMGMPAPKNYVFRIIRKDGKTVWVKNKVSLIEWDNKPAIMASLTDVTQIKETENMLFYLGKLFTHLKKSKSEEDLFRVAVTAIKSVMHFDIAAIFVKNGSTLSMITDSGAASEKVNIPVDSERGIVAWVARNGTPYYAKNTKEDNLYVEAHWDMHCEYATPIMANGEVYGVLDVQRKEDDSISREERMMLDMLASHIGVNVESLTHLRELEESRNLQELMLHIVSHDLKNPFAVITGYLELLKEDYSREYIDEIERAVNRANKIIEQARLFSKLDMKKIKQEMEMKSLQEMILEAYEEIKDKHPHSRIEVNGDARIPVYPILKEAFVNILDNAYKYDATEVRVNVEKDEKRVKIKMADNGKGIEDSKKKILFEAFEKLSKGGSGLGLAIVKKVVELHEGRVWIEDNHPRGSVFIIEIPVQQDFSSEGKRNK